jgi:Niemann-Pick C1 protein
MAVSLVIAGCLIIGVIKFNVTTNPVDLWSSPTSLSRQQMDTFDNAFGPFYRTTQVIITAPQLEGEVYTAWSNSALSTTDTYFSGLFRLDILMQILDFQNQILALTAEYNGQTVTLADICLRPLCNDTPYSRDPNCGIANCTIFSPLNWFQVCFLLLSFSRFVHRIFCLSERPGQSSDCLLQLILISSLQD